MIYYEMKRPLTILGSNSRIYKSIAHELRLHFEIIEKSHKDNLDKISSTAVLFSVDKINLNNNLTLIDNLINSKVTKLILISSVSVLTTSFYKYKYPMIKKSQEDYVKEKFKKYVILRLSTFIDNKSSNRIPYARFYNKTLVNSIIQNASITNNTTLTLVDETSDQFNIKFIYFYMFLIKKIGFKLMRIFDLFIKFFSNYNYGYALISFIELKKKLK